MTTVLTLASPWKPSADRHNSNSNFPFYLGGRSLRRLEGAGIELSSVQLVHKFAATLPNTMIHKQFKNDKKGFGKFGPLAEGRGVSNLAPQLSTRRDRVDATPRSTPLKEGKFACETSLSRKN